ncbi:hypothetical protein N7455_011992 [Penicillium solitum]|uniref:uncharacterized protein n=1 Tax=Penicillium solitum TaxID=60172 RepID=UPI0032C404EF|nr:hypothetical protein N7455_011992 [Penicillium solitum]
MFKAGCLYSCIPLYNKIQQFQGSSFFLPKISGKTVDASGLAGEISQRAAPPFCLLPARPASLHVGSSFLSSLLSTNPPSCHLFLLTYPSHYLYVRL